MVVFHSYVSLPEGTPISLDFSTGEMDEIHDWGNSPREILFLFISPKKTHAISVLLISPSIKWSFF